MNKFCAWCMKSIKPNDESRLKNGQFMHSHCFDENIESNNRMMLEMMEKNKRINS